MPTLKEELEACTGREPLDLKDTVLAISRIPYGRPGRLTPRGVLRDWRGTCSTKHLLLAVIVRAEWPDVALRLWHRPYRVTPDLAEDRWGAGVAGHVPREGLVDVHTFATIEREVRPVRVDVTFPLRAWDGITDTPLACGPGEDIPAGGDPLASKAELVDAHCDPTVREAFIAALSRRYTVPRPDGLEGRVR